MSQQLPCIFIIKALVLSCGRVELKLRQGGAKTPCRWSSRSDLYSVFQSFCKRVLHNEACNAHDEIRRRRKREVSFCDLALHEERQLYTTDKYFQAETAEPTYQMAGKEITPKLLLEAIRTLPEEKRTAILLYYFEGMTDVEIGKMFNTSRSTIQYRRTSSFELLKKYLEEHADEWNEW